MVRVQIPAIPPNQKWYYMPMEIRWNNTPIEDIPESKPEKPESAYTGMGVSPMTGPSGLIFALKAKYEAENRNIEKLADSMIDGRLHVCPSSYEDAKDHVQRMKKLALEYNMPVIADTQIRLIDDAKADPKSLTYVMVNKARGYVPVRVQTRNGTWINQMMSESLYNRIMDVVNNKVKNGTTTQR